jgi:hypothetical protein
MTEQEFFELRELFAPLHSGLTNIATVADRPRLLAHYTSLEVLEKIVQHNELWFSHPFFMNDIQEMRFGIAEGCKVFDKFSRHQEFIALCGTEVRAAKLASYFFGCLSAFELKNKFDVYVLCFSDHDDVAAADGLLSMWRGYGANGNGAALIFKIDHLKPSEHSPLLLGKVVYATDAERVKWFEEMFRKGLKILQSESISDDKLHIAAMVMFDSMKLFALLSKHQGFQEEKEWRIIYLPDRDKRELLKGQISYSIGKRGIEPKLKYKVEPLQLEPRETWTFHSVLHKIILGPSLSSQLTIDAVYKMLVAHNKSDFREKLSASGIPLRSSAG